MLKNKGLVIGLLALVIAGAYVFYTVGGKQADVNTAPPTAAETTVPAAEDAPAQTAEQAAPAPEQEQQKAEETATAAPVAAPAQSTDLLAAPASAQVDVDAAMKDKVLGNPDAPVTIYEYASLTCPHCAHFATTILPQVKKSLLDTGKAKLIFRDFPLDRFAVKASMMAHCVSPVQYYNMLEVIFSNQERWTHDADPLQALAQLGALAGLDEASFKVCTENKALENAILNRMQDGQKKYDISSTPTFVFNDGAEKFQGAQPVEKFEEIVNKLSAGK